MNALAFVESYNQKKRIARDRILAEEQCRGPKEALVCLRYGQSVEAANELLAGEAGTLPARSLDVQIYYQILAMGSPHLSGAARANITSICEACYNSELPTNASLDLPFDPWNYLLCGCPTENHLFNDTSNRLADTVVFPERVYSDGRTAAEYRLYWEDAFRQLVASRVKHGMREWRSSIYCHVIFDDAFMIYSIMPDGPTKEAARVLLDFMFLNIALSLRNGLWAGPHSRVYNNEGGCNIFDFTTQCYPPFARQLYTDSILPSIIVSDYVPPEAIVRLPDRPDRYVSIEKVGPRFHPRGEGAGVFNPRRYNPFLCTNDREDRGGDGIIYNYLTPRYVLGSTQDWGNYGGEFHMHCLPWCLMIAAGETTDIVLSFAGSEADTAAGYNQGGYATWPNEHNDQDATIFQHRNVLISQMRACFHPRKAIWSQEPHPEAPWTIQNTRMLGYKGDRVPLRTRFYIPNSIGNLRIEDRCVFGEKAGVCFAVRSIWNDFREDEHGDWIPGRVFVCDVWDEVLIIEVGETEEFGSFEEFQQKVLDAPLVVEGDRVDFTTTAGEELSFTWKENGPPPTVNGVTPEYGGMRINDPCVKSEYASGVIEVNCGGAAVTLRAEDPENIHREESP